MKLYAVSSRLSWQDTRVSCSLSLPEIVRRSAQNIGRLKRANDSHGAIPSVRVLRVNTVDRLTAWGMGHGALREIHSNYGIEYIDATERVRHDSIKDNSGDLGPMIRTPEFIGLSVRDATKTSA